MNYKLKYIFPNYLDCQNVVAIPGNAIVVDIFQMKTVNTKKPRDSFKVFFAVDLATAEFIVPTVFRIPGKRKGEVPAHKVIRVLRHALRNRDLEVGFILHSDRGIQFASKEWHLFVNELGATGSMSELARPTSNSVAERSIRTLREQLLQCPTSFPTRVKSLREIQAALDQRVAYYNEHFRPKRACGSTPDQLRPALIAAKHLAPPKRITYYNHDVNHKAILKFKEESLESFYLRNHPYYMLRETRDGVQRIELQNIQIEQNNLQVQHQLHTIEKKIDALKQVTKKVQRKKVPLRDPANNTIYNWIMQQPREPQQSRRNFWRFRLAITLLRFTGMRATEVAAITKPQIETAIQYGHIDIILAKTRRTHRYVFTQHARDAISKLQVERINVFQQHQKLAAGMLPQHWIRFLNRNLQSAVKHFGLNIKSHSFRVAYVTHLLKYAPVQHTAVIVGHSDIRSTIAYNRYVPDRKHVIELLEREEPSDS